MKPHNRTSLETIVLSEGFSTVVAELASLARLKASQATDKTLSDTWEDVGALLMLAALGTKINKI